VSTTEVLDLYGTIGFWAEDAVESIHSILNVLIRRYAALDKCIPDLSSCCSQKRFEYRRIGLEEGSWQEHFTEEKQGPACEQDVVRGNTD
jgi:hypothetical protein